MLRFWLDLGVDGLCLNGAAYLVERDGTPCEHLPETHAVLKQIRQRLEAEYPDRMIQAGRTVAGGRGGLLRGRRRVPHGLRTCRWPAAVPGPRQEDRHPVADILRQTPGSAGGLPVGDLFLRNHDELTLDAGDRRGAGLHVPRVRRPTRGCGCNAGIRRRLAPLLDNDRRRIELLYGLLFSLPGTPVIYYGDEIGMGDNVYLGGRERRAHADAVGARPQRRLLGAPTRPASTPRRSSTPCTATRRSTSRPSGATRRRCSTWMRRLIALRRRRRALPAGGSSSWSPATARCWRSSAGTATSRSWWWPTCRGRPSRSSWTWPTFAGLVPVEMFGRIAFPPIGDAAVPADARPARLLLVPAPDGGRGGGRPARPGGDRAGRGPADPDVPRRMANAPGRRRPRGELERDVLPGYLRSQRWFGGKAREVVAVQRGRHGPAPGRNGAPWRCSTSSSPGGHRDLYFLPLAVAARSAAARC